MREQKDRYEIFLKVCETGSFSKAAEALNYTQCGISQMMAGLEEELGVQLFARINRGVTLPQLFQYPLIIETPGCDNDIQHLMLKCPVKPNIAYSFRDDTLILAFVRSGLGVTISQELVMQAFGCPGVVSRPLEPACCRTLGLAFSKTASSVVSRTLLEYLQKIKR